MTLSEIQTNLQSIILGIPQIGALPQVVIVDDGTENAAIETNLQELGLAILIMDPQATLIEDAGRGTVRLAYSTTVWLRTSPKVLTDAGIPRWSPFALEELILVAVMQWSRPRMDYGFTIPPGLEPETDWADIGNHSRLIRFATHINFN